MAISLSDIITQNTLNKSEGFPQGVPTSWNWYNGWSDEGLHTPPANFTAVEGWGAVYNEVGEPISNANAAVEVANAKTYLRIKETGQWVLAQNQSAGQLAGGHFVNDFTGNAGYAMTVSSLPGGAASFAAPPSGYNDHFWYQSRGTYVAGTVDAVYVQMDMRVTSPNANLVAIVGADWWRDASAPYLQDHSNNPGIGSSNWVELSTQWRTLGYFSPSTAEFQANLPPPLRGAVTTPPVTSNPDITAPAAPRIAAFTPDTGAVGDKITSASVLTLTGTAEAGSTVKLFDGSTQVGTASANSSGAWSIATSNLATGTHNFTAKATDVAGNISSASSLLSIRVDAASQPPAPPSGTNLLVNGSFEASSVAANGWAGFSSIPGWTAISGGTIELWNNLNDVKATDGSNFGELDYHAARDGFFQTVKTVAGQRYDLSFDARSRPGFTSSTTTIEVLWNDTVIAAVPPGSAWSWNTYNFSVTGTGGQDRLTFREVAAQGADGLGALYDNVSLVPAGAGAPTTPTTPPPIGTNLLTNGSFEGSSLASNSWAGFGSVPGWTAISGGTIELWNNHNGVQATNGKNFGELDYSSARDGLSQAVKTVAGQSYELSFDARSRPGVSSTTTAIEVLWNNSVVAVVPPGSIWKNYEFSVIGTGGQDRLTFRETAGQSTDGLGALYDNVSLVAVGTASATSQSAFADTTQAMNLMTQFSATSFPNSSVSPIAGLQQTDTSTALAQTLAKAV